jgi:hypothetical protein
MLLVTFHGGSAGITNAYAYDTTTGDLISRAALQSTPLGGAELRGMVYANSYLYAVNGAKFVSDILCYQPQAAGTSPNLFRYLGEFLGPSLSKKGHFRSAIGHPYALQFFRSGDATYVFVSNQDTNVVARATVAPDFRTASIEPGCQSSYLKGLTGIGPESGCVYLDGTFVASQDGTLPDVAVAATDVPAVNGGLSIKCFYGSAGSAGGKGKAKVENSVRDLAISGAVLLVCDEPSQVIRLYSLPDGTYLGESPKLPASPTHLAIFANGLYVSAGDQLYWSALRDPLTPSALAFQSVLTAPAGSKVGGVAFGTTPDMAIAVFVAFQQGTGTTGTGSISRYHLGGPPAAPPVFGTSSTIASQLPDTPEFLLFVPDL